MKKPDLKGAFGKIIRELREARGLSQQALADYAEVDRTFLSRVERGVSNPSLETVYKLAESLKMKPHELIQKVDKEVL